MHRKYNFDGFFCMLLKLIVYFEKKIVINDISFYFIVIPA